MLRLIFLLAFPSIVSAQLHRFEFSEIKMGAPFRIIFYHTDSIEASNIARDCYSLVDSLNDIFSDYSETSELSRLASMSIVQDQKISDELLQMILRSKEAWRRSGKAFDVTIGSLSQLWRKAKRENRFPSTAAIIAAKELTGFNHIMINQVSKTIAVKKPGIRFDFGGIVPGYAAQRVMDLLKSRNVHSALVDASGDIVVSNPPPGKNGWTVAINLPESDNAMWDQKLELKNLAVSTSGDVYRYMIHDGKRYSHIIDPRTGYGLTSQRNVTVITKNGPDADWLATACSVLPVKKALSLAKGEHAVILIAILKNDKIVTYKSPGFNSYFANKHH